MRSAFEHFLRTGRRDTQVAAVETKFNPWHDPDNGRFTFAGQGRRAGGQAASPDGSAGHGGSFGGGGASGTWKPGVRRDRAGASRNLAAPRREAIGERTSRSPKPIVVRTPRASAQQPRLTIRENGYDYAIDAHARPRRINGELKLQQQPRSRGAQANAGKPDRRNTDGGGHYIATRFNGPRKWFNHFAQDSNFNRGVYRTLEDQWANAIRSNKRVFVDIVPHYRGVSMRPHKLDIVWFIDGQRFFRGLINERQGK